MNLSFDAVTLDAAGTILQPAPSVGHVYSDVAQRYGVHVDPERIQEHFVRAWQAGTAPHGPPAPFDKPDDAQYAWWKTLVEHAFTTAGVYHDFGPKFPGFYSDLYERFALPAAWHIFEDVEPFLDRMAASRIPVGIVSNWDNRLKRLIAATPLAPRIAFVLTSAEAGTMKPHAQIFHDAARRLRVPPGRVLHIGDSPREDLEGARQAGLQGILIDRRKKFPETMSVYSLDDVV